MDSNGGGQGFPVPPAIKGMSFRDYFAAQAMGAMIQRLGPIMKINGTGGQIMPDSPAVTEDDGRQIRAAVAEVAYRYADAMLTARDGK